MNQESSDQIAAEAEQFADNVERQVGVALGFDASSLARLDALLAEWLDMAAVYDRSSDGMLESLHRPIACFVGEVLVRAFGAEWLLSQRAEPGPPLLRLRTGQKFDVAAAVATVLRGSAPPAFHELVRTLGSRSSSESEPQ